MANKIILKKTSTASKVPLPADLEVGEIAVNLADQKLYSKNASGTVILVGDGQGTGDVSGGSSSTDNAIARYDGTTGKVIQNSTVTISDTGAIAGAESISNIDFAQFDTTVTPVEAVAKMQWDDGNGTLQLGLKGGNVNLQIGQEIVARVYNDSGVALTDGQIVYISGAQGNRVAVKLALADSDTTSAGTLGMVTEPIAIGAEGFITILGTVNGLNTIGLTQGAIVYLSPTVAGAYTTTKPVAPQHTVTIGYVERVHATVGSIYVKVDNGYELDELHNVLITSPTTGQTLVYNSSTGVWSNQGVNAILPSQSGNSGKVLGTDGTNVSWVDGGGGGSAFFTRYNFTATASQTTFAVGVTLTLIEVYNNGSRLIPTTDYSISGTNVVLTSGASVGSIISVLVYTTFDVANTYTQAQTDALVANKANTDGSNATGTWGISISGNSATATTATSATKLSSTNWVVEETAGVLYFKYSGVNKAKLDSSGNFTCVGNVTAFGTV